MYLFGSTRFQLSIKMVLGHQVLQAQCRMHFEAPHFLPQHATPLPAYPSTQAHCPWHAPLFQHAALTFYSSSIQPSDLSTGSVESSVNFISTKSSYRSSIGL